MAYIKCNDCGKIYDTGLESCPQCGCPTEQQQLTPTLNSDDNTPVDITEMFFIKEDKFEETKDIIIGNSRIFSSSIDDLCKSLQIDSSDGDCPLFFLNYHIEKGDGQIRILYSDYELLKKIEDINDENLADKYVSPCKRMIINIDDRENIRLDLENNESISEAFFPISQESFLKCCNAKKLEFKITKENGASVIVNGYYSFDPETGVEIDVNGDAVLENDFILSFQALYNYVIDPNMFKDALKRRQMLDELIEEKNKEIKDKETQQVANEENQKFNENMGVVWLVIGIIGALIGIFLMLKDNIIVNIVIGICMFFISPIIAVYGGTRMKGLNSSDAINKMVKGFMNKFYSN